VPVTSAGYECRFRNPLFNVPPPQRRRRPLASMQRAKIQWSDEETNLLRALVAQHGTQWTKLSHIMQRSSRWTCLKELGLLRTPSQSEVAADAHVRQQEHILLILPTSVSFQTGVPLVPSQTAASAASGDQLEPQHVKASPAPTSRPPVILQHLRQLGLSANVKVLRKFVVNKAVLSNFLAAAASAEYYPILDKGNEKDWRRGSARMPEGMQALSSPEFLSCRNKLKMHKGEVIFGGTFLRSLPGGGVQSWHRDFHPTKVMREKQLNGMEPRTLLMSLSEEGYVYLRGTAGEVIRVRLAAGDAVLFNALTWHAGHGYNCLHYRAHWYMEVHPLKIGAVSLVGKATDETDLFYPSNGEEVVGEITHVLD